MSFIHTSDLFKSFQDLTPCEMRVSSMGLRNIAPVMLKPLNIYVTVINKAATTQNPFQMVAKTYHSMT